MNDLYSLRKLKKQSSLTNFKEQNSIEILKKLTEIWKNIVELKIYRTINPFYYEW